MHDGVPDDTLWTADEMVAALVRRGWGPGGKTPRNSVAATLSRLTQMGELERVNSGLYRLAAHKRQPSTPAATGEEGQLDMGHEGGNP